MRILLVAALLLLSSLGPLGIPEEEQGYHVCQEVAEAGVNE